MRTNYPAERDQLRPEHKQPLGGTNLNNLNSRLFNNSRNMSRTASNEHLYRPHNHSYASDSDSNSVDLTAILNTGQVFPEDLLVLLIEESSNIKTFKARIQKEKGKVVNDMEMFKKEIIHIIQDLKISMTAELDLSYKLYIEKYAFLKSEVQEIRRLKKQIETQNVGRIDTRLHSSASNSDMVKEIQQQVMNLRSYKISQYVNDIQRKKLFPLLQLSKELIILTTSPFQFYDAAMTSGKLTELKEAFSHFTRHMFTGLKQLIRTPEALLQKGRMEFSELGQATNRVRQASQQSLSARREVQHRQPQIGRQENFVISQSEQAMVAKEFNSFTARLNSVVKPPHSDVILCLIGVHNKYIVSGGKDGLLNVMTYSGSKVATLRGHESSVCSLALISHNGGSYLASGGDYGCSSIIIWDINTWAIRTKLKYHSAAVTCIVDLEDGQTIVSGSYDKKINLYNIKEPSLLYNLPNNKSPVAAMVLNANKNKLVSTGLDGKIYVWSITRGSTGIVESIHSQRILSNDQVICSLSSSLLNPKLVVTGTMDGKVKFWNISTGEVERDMAVNDGPIVQLVMIQFQTKSPVLLSCSAKDQALTVTNTETNSSSLLDLNNKLYLQFGCGIGPKVIFERVNGGPGLVVLNHSSETKEIALFQMDFK